MSDDARDLAPEAISLVRQWLAIADEVPVPRAAGQLAGMLRDPAGLEFVVSFVDEVVRPEDLQVAARNLARICSSPPAFLDWYLRAGARIGALLAPALPKLVVPVARRILRHMVGHLIVDATDSKLSKAIAHLRKQGASLNLNLLGEAVLGEREAERRLAGTKALLARDDVDYVSIKVSATVAPQPRWSFDTTVEHVIEKLRPLYRLAAESSSPKFINLDMEEYKDLDLTITVFTRLLDEPEFHNLPAGIVLQAYLPDAMSAMIHLQGWAAQRVANGGAPIKVRLVKGANLPMELVEAEVHDWPVATYPTKQASDTNYIRVMNYALQPDHIRNVRLGVAGHNLFDIALAWLLANKRGVTQGIDFEMLVGMAPGQAEAVRRTVGGMLLYVPVVRPAEFDVAIAYLIRRLEEGSSHENFMSAVFELSRNSSLFDREKDRFLASLNDLDFTVPHPNRQQSRLDEDPVLPHDHFVQTCDSDPSVPANQIWAAQLREQMGTTTLGQDLADASWVRDADALETRLATAVASDWSSRSGAERAEVLHRAGDELARKRGELMALAGAECGKTLDQSDPEVSEAVDFAHYYAELARKLDSMDGANHHPAKLILVTPPWNFPLAIPAGGMLAALASGAPVIVKPARSAARCSAAIVESLWKAGVPKDALQYVQLDDRELRTKLVRDSRVERLILTGGYETARAFKETRADLNLLAETSGKNAIIVTPNADLDLAVKDVVYSAFGHAGQKCSAASLVILVGQVARSRRFRNQLVDAVRSLKVGWPSDPTAEMGPLTSPASGKLLEGLTSLDPGQTWLVEPRRLDDAGQLWSPGVRLGVQPGSKYHQIEYFGPILGIMTTETLDEAIDLVNAVSYGLTSGLHSLDREEIDLWLRRIHAGNLYVNRGTTGAIVQRQPFGGWKRSVVGPTCKAGGPNYLTALSDWTPAESTAQVKPSHPDVLALLRVAEPILSADELAFVHRGAASDQAAWDEEFGVAKDVQGLRSERNILRYLPYQEPVTVRLGTDQPISALIRVVAAAIVAGKRPTLSTAAELPGELRSLLVGLGMQIRVNSDEQFAASLNEAPAGRIRLIGELASWPKSADLAIYRGPVTEAGRIEQLPFYSEQAVSITSHRFGTPNHLTTGLL